MFSLQLSLVSVADNSHFCLFHINPFSKHKIQIDVHPKKNILQLSLSIGPVRSKAFFGVNHDLFKPWFKKIPKLRTLKRQKNIELEPARLRQVEQKIYYSHDQ